MPWVRSAIDELFRRQPTAASGEVGFTSLSAWLDDHAETLIDDGKLERESFANDRDILLDAPRRLSAILLFDKHEFHTSRINENAFPKNMISHRDIAEIEKIMSGAVPTWSRRLATGPD